MKTNTILTSLLVLVLASCSGLKDGEYHLEILSTNDVHGSWFDQPYTGGRAKRSLLSVNHYVDSIRTAAGADNVILIDAGDCLQGDNAAYYFNYVDSLAPHLYPRIAKYMGYDAIAVGNHDIETGHAVYDRIDADLKAAGIPFLAGNAIRSDNAKPYFPAYTILKKAGLKVAVLGFTNANIKAWLNESLWSGMTFQSLIPLVQKKVDEVLAKEKPQVVIVAVHSGTGRGDGSMYESQGLDLFKTLKGVDFLLCSHDHRAYTESSDSLCLINAGSRAGDLGHGTIDLTVNGGKVVSKTMTAGLIPVRAEAADPQMREYFKADYETVKEFTLKPVGELGNDIQTHDAFRGMCDYMNLIHTLSLTPQSAQLSFAAPLKANGSIKAGTLIYNDLFTIYPYENQLFVVRLSGKEIKDYLEFSYDAWINTVRSENDHLLRIRPFEDRRTGETRWSFTGATFNFDSAAGINYTVDVTKECGSRVEITTLASGEPFSEDATYNVAMTSYRASGGGELLSKGAGVDTDHIEDRVVEKLPELREILYQYLQTHCPISSETVCDPSRLGHWAFVPDPLATRLLDRDYRLLYD